MTTAAETQIHSNGQAENYLNCSYGIRSWLLTLDHKRIGILYLVTITLFFALGGIFASLIRLELMTPAGDLVESETYNKLFTMHGVVMIFFFLLPSVPAVLGNFVLPVMIGAKNVAFPNDFKGCETSRKSCPRPPQEERCNLGWRSPRTPVWPLFRI